MRKRFVTYKIVSAHNYIQLYFTQVYIPTIFLSYPTHTYHTPHFTINERKATKQKDRMPCMHTTVILLLWECGSQSQVVQTCHSPMEYRGVHCEAAIQSKI